MCQLQYTLFPFCGCKWYSQIPNYCAEYQEAHPTRERYGNRETIICECGNYDGAYDEKPLHDGGTYYGTLPKGSKDDFPWIDCDHKTFKESVASSRKQCLFDCKLWEMKEEKVREERAEERKKEKEKQEKRENSGIRRLRKDIRHAFVVDDAVYPPGHDLAGMVAPTQFRRFFG